jgi:hypothetical protein
MLHETQLEIEEIARRLVGVEAGILLSCGGGVMRGHRGAAGYDGHD